MSTPHTYSVLIVEDNPDIVIGLQDLLQHEGYDVRVAESVATAIELFQIQRFNAVLLDLGLPDGDGLDVLKAIRQRDPSLPVIIITAHIATERTVGSLTQGAFAYLTKPYNREELRQTLRRAIGVKELAVKVEQTQHLLTESEDRFRSLVESATDAIIVANKYGIIVSWNRAASRLFDYSDEEIVGHPLTKLMPLRYRHAHEVGLTRIESTGKGRVIGSVVELHGLRKDGTEFPIELSLATWKTSAGSYYSGIIRDITQRKQAEQALEQLQHQHELILNQAGEGIYGIDQDGNTTFVNPSAACMLGYRVEELLGRHMHDLLHHSKPDGTPYPVQDCPIYAATKDGMVHRAVDEIFWRQDGTSFPVEYVSTPIREKGRVIGAVVVFRDITERRNAELALRLSEERLEFVVRGSNDGFWDWRVVEGQPWHSPRTPVWWSPRVRDMLGYTEAEFPDVLDSWASRLHSDDRPRVFEALRAHIERRIPYDAEYRLHAKSGEYHWFRARGQAIWDAHGQPVRMSGSLQSIMDRKRAEDALRRSQQVLQDIADHTTAVIYVKDLEGRFLFVNRRFEEIFDLTTDRILGRTNHELFPREIADAFRANDLQVLELNRVMEYEETAPQADGLHTYLSIKLPLRDHAGTPYATCGISTDITERKRMEEALRTHEEQLQLAIRSTEVGAWFWHLDSDRMEWCPQVDRFLGLSKPLPRKTSAGLIALVHPDDRALVTSALRQAADPSSTRVLLEHRVQTPHGTVQWCVWTGHVVRDGNGKGREALGTVRVTTALNRPHRERMGSGT